MEDYLFHALKVLIDTYQSFYFNNALYLYTGDAEAIDLYHGRHVVQWESDAPQSEEGNEEYKNYCESIGYEICERCIPKILKDQLKDSGVIYNVNRDYQNIDKSLAWTLPQFLDQYAFKGTPGQPINDQYNQSY